MTPTSPGPNPGPLRPRPIGPAAPGGPLRPLRPAPAPSPCPATVGGAGGRPAPPTAPKSGPRCRRRRWWPGTAQPRRSSRHPASRGQMLARADGKSPQVWGDIPRHSHPPFGGFLRSKLAQFPAHIIALYQNKKRPRLNHDSRGRSCFPCSYLFRSFTFRRKVLYPTPIIWAACSMFAPAPLSVSYFSQSISNGARPGPPLPPFTNCL